MCTRSLVLHSLTELLKTLIKQLLGVDRFTKLLQPVSIDGTQKQRHVEEQLIVSYERPPDFDESFVGVEWKRAISEVCQI